MTTTLDALAVLAVEECPTCYVMHAIPRSLLTNAKEKGATWYCPNGHATVFRTTELQRVRAELEKAQRAAITARKERDEAHQTTEREVKKRKAIERRAGNGVCLACHRTFANVLRHMASKHPGISGT